MEVSAHLQRHSHNSCDVGWIVDNISAATRKAAADALTAVIATAQIKAVVRYFAIMRLTLEECRDYA